MHDDTVEIEVNGTELCDGDGCEALAGPLLVVITQGDEQPLAPPAVVGGDDGRCLPDL